MSWNAAVQERQPELAQHEIGRQRLGADRRIPGDHAQEEEQRRDDRERTGEQARDDRVAVLVRCRRTGRITTARRPRCSSRRSNPANAQPLGARRRREARSIARVRIASSAKNTKSAYTAYRKNDAYLNSHSTRPLPKAVNAAMRAIRQSTPAMSGQPNIAAPIAPAAAPYTARIRMKKNAVGRFEQDPERPEQAAEEGCGNPCSRSCARTGRSTTQMRLNRTVESAIASSAAPGTDGHEEFRELAAGSVAAADHHCLERESREQESLEPGRTRHEARQASTSRSKAGPPRIGSATGRPSACGCLLHQPSSAAAADSALVLKLTPAQRMEGFVSAPDFRLSAIASASDGVGKPG